MVCQMMMSPPRGLERLPDPRSRDHDSDKEVKMWREDWFVVSCGEQGWAAVLRSEQRYKRS